MIFYYLSFSNWWLKWSLELNYQKSEIIQKSLFIIMFFRKSNQYSTCSKNSSAKSAVVMLSQVNINKAYLITWHIMIRMLLYS